MTDTLPGGTGAIKFDETYIGKGAIREDIQDPRVPVFGKDIGMASPPFDWNAGWDIEAELSKKFGKKTKLTVKDQDNSSSCGGQAFSYLGQAILGMKEGDIRERSAKFIYAQVFQGVGGSAGRDIQDLLINQGWGLEADCTSYQNNTPPNEQFMQRVEDISITARANAKPSMALSKANVLLDMEIIAQATRDNYASVIGLTGKNNGSWRTTNPLPPKEFSNSWNHFLLLGKIKMENGRKKFGVLNSWGTGVGENGWQWLDEDYFNFRFLGYPAIWAIFTLVVGDKVPTPTIPLYVFKKTLKLGMKGEDVKELQIRLNRIMFNLVQLKVDGDFGAKTAQAVLNFQSLRGLIQDGTVGPKTIAELAKILST